MNRETWDSLREGWSFEAKLARGQDGRGKLPNSFWATYSAFANTNGGEIVLGVEERDDGSLDAQGVVDIDKVERELWNELYNRMKVSANLVSRPLVRHEQYDGACLLVVRVPKAARKDRPVYIDNRLENAFIRVGDGDQRMDQETLRRMLRDAEPTHDAEAIAGTSIDDLSPDSIRRYRNVLSSVRPGHPFLSEDNHRFLVQIGAMKDPCNGKNGEVTHAGMITLGREHVIRAFYPHWFLDYRESSPGTSKQERWADRIRPDGTWNANILEFFFKVINKLHGVLRVPFSLDQGLFRVDDTPVHEAVREALVNTLIHADNHGHGGIRVESTATGFEFSNPGMLLVTPEQMWNGGSSESRNPIVQHMFGLLDLGERAGSGGPAIQRAWSEQHWQRPEIVQDVNRNETRLIMRFLNLLPKSSANAVQATLGQAFDVQDHLGRVALVTAHAEHGMTHARLSDLTGAHSRDVTLKLQELVRRGLLVPSGSPRARTYSFPDIDILDQRLTSSEQTSEQSGTCSEQTSEQTATNSEQTSEQSGTSSEQTSEQSGTCSEQTSVHTASCSEQTSEQSGTCSEQTSVHTATCSEQTSEQSGTCSEQTSVETATCSEQTSEHTGTSSEQTSEQSATCSEQTSEQTATCSEQTSEQSTTNSDTCGTITHTRGWKTVSDQLDGVIAFCRDDWRTLPEIARAIRRQESTVRTKYLRPLLDNNALLRRYPDNPKHPHQAYRSSEGSNR
ncbi:MAG: putative DNA binding domain-containing protein [Polyangiaceae bacterium]|nr:putative DNA binding domain-containing protein [Polyangiaceae bacterium]